MTDSTLSITLDTLRSAVCRYLGVAAYNDLDAETSHAVDLIINSGLRQFYFPPKLYDNEPPHEWSFLKPVTTLETILPYSAGTVSVSDGIVDLTGGQWPEWAATNGILYIEGVRYHILERTTSRYLLVTGDNVDAGATYELKHNGNYTLPPTFGGIEGFITYEHETYAHKIILVGEGQIRAMRQGAWTTGRPAYAAVRPMQSTGSSGQRYELMLYPIPDDVFTLTFRSRVLPDALVASSSQYPLGTAIHGETILASCLAAAELHEDEKEGPRRKYFMERLSASVQHDKTMDAREFFGYNGDREPDSGMPARSQGFNVTYNGSNPWE